MLVSTSPDKKVDCMPSVLIMQETEWWECAPQWIMHFSPPGSWNLPYHTKIHYVEQTFYLYNKLQNYSFDQLQVGRQGNGASLSQQRPAASLQHQDLSFLRAQHALVLVVVKEQVLITNAQPCFPGEVHIGESSCSQATWRRLPWQHEYCPGFH